MARVPILEGIFHDHAISHATLAKVAAKNDRNGVSNPSAFRRKAISEEEILASPMLNYPLTKYMFWAEVIPLAENGFCKDGEQEKLVADGELEIAGRLPVNTDGGLIANGEPIGASGFRQVHEVCCSAASGRATGRFQASPRWGTRSSMEPPAPQACRFFRSDVAAHAHPTCAAT